MEKGRLEAFSDGVLAIIITIMVLELKPPVEAKAFKELVPLIPKFLFYLLSFIYLGIYWNNHHHLFKAISSINGKFMWANLSLLFFLSLIPFATAWMGEHVHDSDPMALYGGILLLCALNFNLLERLAISNEEQDSIIHKSLNKFSKEKISLVLYIVGIILSYFFSYLGLAAYAGVAILWIIPDSRIEKNILKE